MDAGEVVFGELVVAGGDASEVLNAVDEAFDEVALLIEEAAKAGRRLRLGMGLTSAQAPPLGEPLAQPVAVVGGVGEKRMLGPDGVEHVLCAPAVVCLALVSFSVIGRPLALGYEIGEIKAEGAMTSEIGMRNDVTLEAVNKYVEIERRTLDRYEGINRKYTPFMFNLVTGAGICGGRYVFDSWDHVQAYDKWLEGLELEPGVKFWDRPIFTQVDKHIWKVVGAHDFTPVATHGVNRFERWRYDAPADEMRAKLDALWPALRAEAERQDLGTAWLLV